jgi:hypothetical protein
MNMFRVLGRHAIPKPVPCHIPRHSIGMAHRWVHDNQHKVKDNKICLSCEQTCLDRLHKQQREISKKFLKEKHNLLDHLTKQQREYWVSLLKDERAITKEFRDRDKEMIKEYSHLEEKSFKKTCDMEVRVQHLKVYLVFFRTFLI